jgi:hypothetical protein
MNRWRWSVLFLLAAATAAYGGRLSFQEQAAVKDSLRAMPMWEQVRWLARRGLPDPYLRDCTPVEDSGLRCLGRWSYGPSTWVDVRATDDDTIIFLSRGSGVSVIRFRSQDSLRLDLLSDINSHGLTGRCQVRDTLLYVNSGGVECYNISSLSNPVLLNWLSQPLIYDFFVVDTFLYTSSRDSLRIFSVSNPASPRWLGACADSGYVMYVSGNHAYLGHQAGLFILDVSNPASPHRVATMGFDVLSIWVQDTLLYFGTYDSTFRVFNVSNPASPSPVGSLGGIAPACLYLPPTCDTVIYSPAFDVISLANPAAPRRVGSVSPPGWEYGVAAVPALNYALVADCFDGLAAINITNPSAPSIDTFLYNAGLSEDIYLNQSKAYVAQHQAGLRILDVTNPASPYLLGQADTLGTRPSTHTAVARDSFAYVGWTGVPYFRSFDVHDPTRPEYSGGVDVINPLEDMVLRDSFAYVSELGCLQIVNVARPREPLLLGTLGLGSNDAWSLALQDSLAYVTSYPLAIVSVADPSHPRAVGNIWRGAFGIAVRDTFVYVAGADLFTYSVAKPAQPYLVDSLHVGDFVSAVAVADTLLYIGCDQGMRVVNVADPSNPIVVGFASAPYPVWKVTYDAPYIYAVCSNAGVCVFETTQTGVAERSQTGTRTRHWLGIRPTVSTDAITIAWAGFGCGQVRLSVYDATGRRVARKQEPGYAFDGEAKLSLGRLAPGAYFIEVKSAQRTEIRKVLKR